MTDDLLDKEKDEAECKLTYVTLLGEERTKTEIDLLSNDIEQILQQYSGEAADYLSELARKIAVRKI